MYEIDHWCGGLGSTSREKGATQMPSLVGPHPLKFGDQAAKYTPQRYTKCPFFLFDVTICIYANLRWNVIDFDLLR